MFNCTNCGLCCKNISNVKELQEFDLGNGVCKYLDTITNNCIIYNDRPDICNVERMYKIKYNTYFSKEEFYILNTNVCIDLQNKFNLIK